MVGMVRMLIHSDRTGSWLMHFQTVSNCQTVFAVAGHLNYLRSAHYYLQQISNQGEMHQDVYRKLFDGLTLFVGAISAGQDLVMILSLKKR